MKDRQNIQQIFGCLMEHPQFLSEIDKYSLEEKDFSELSDKYVFCAINNLYAEGGSKIRPADIYGYYEQSEKVLTIFNQHKTIEFLNECSLVAEVDNFPAYYSSFKKMRLLEALQKEGYNTSKYYCENALDIDAAQINEKFANLKIDDILSDVKKGLLKIESKYTQTDENEVHDLEDDIDSFLEELDSTESIGMPIQGEIMNEVINGAKKGTLTIRSASSGLGKTRLNVADACYLAFPIRYEESIEQWVRTGHNEKVIFVATEQTYEEIQKMVIAYLSGVNESKFKINRYSPAEYERIQQAIDLIRQFRNLKIIRIPDPNVGTLKTLLREQCLLFQADYIFYDYIFASSALYKEYSGQALRTDEALLLLSTALKNIAVELNVAVFSSTQVNAKADDNKEIRNEASLAGARSIINKADNGIIMSRPTNDELDILHQAIVKNNMTAPNIVSDVYKVRSGQWSQVRVWSYFDRGTLRWRDLFMTDSKLQLLNEWAFSATNQIVYDEEQEKLFETLIDNLNERDKKN